MGASEEQGCRPAISSETNALGELRQLMHWHVTSSGKSSRVALVEVRDHATESLGLLPRPHLGFIPCGFASYDSLYHEGWVFNPPKIRRLEQHDVKQNPGATRPVSD